MQVVIQYYLAKIHRLESAIQVSVITKKLQEMPGIWISILRLSQKTRHILRESFFTQLRCFIKIWAELLYRVIILHG